MTSVTAWQRALRAADLPHHVKATLYILSTYADWKTGEHIRPGELLHDECHIPRKTAYNHIQEALAAGWLVQTFNGGAGSGKKKWANEYRLAVPEKHVSPMTHASEDAQKHGSPVADASPKHGSPVTHEHGSPVTRHLVIEPNQKATSSYDDGAAEGIDRAKGSTRSDLSARIIKAIGPVGNVPVPVKGLPRLLGRPADVIQRELDALVADGTVQVYDGGFGRVTCWLAKPQAPAQDAEKSPARAKAVDLIKEYATLSGRSPGDIEAELRDRKLKVGGAILVLQSWIADAEAARDRKAS